MTLGWISGDLGLFGRRTFIEVWMTSSQMRINLTRQLTQKAARRPSRAGGHMSSSPRAVAVSVWKAGSERRWTFAVPAPVPSSAGTGMPPGAWKNRSPRIFSECG